MFFFQSIIFIEEIEPSNHDSGCRPSYHKNHPLICYVFLVNFEWANCLFFKFSFPEKQSPDTQNYHNGMAKFGAWFLVNIRLSYRLGEN